MIKVIGCSFLLGGIGFAVGAYAAKWILLLSFCVASVYGTIYAVVAITQARNSNRNACMAIISSVAIFGLGIGFFMNPPADIDIPNAEATLRYFILR